MQVLKKVTLITVVTLAAGAVGLVACRGNLPLDGPPQPTADGAPALRTNDGPTGPRSDEGLSSPPDSTGGTNSLVVPPLTAGSGGTSAQ